MSIKIKTKKMSSFPGDKTIQIFAIDENKRQIPLMNINKRTYQGYSFYENDTVTNTFKTITEAKKWCLDNKCDFSF